MSGWVLLAVFGWPLLLLRGGMHCFQLSQETLHGPTVALVALTILPPAALLFPILAEAWYLTLLCGALLMFIYGMWLVGSLLVIPHDWVVIEMLVLALIVVCGTTFVPLSVFASV